LDLAQYREKQAFAQFGSDLDAATRAQLNRGERLVEILKQDQYKPMPIELQVASIFAVSSGACDKLAVDQLRTFEKALHEHLLATQKEILDTIKVKGSLDKDQEAKLDQVTRSFVDKFQAGLSAVGGSSNGSGRGKATAQPGATQASA
jgi:F0F1-type ATP synthase alpha subunit